MAAPKLKAEITADTSSFDVALKKLQFGMDSFASKAALAGKAAAAGLAVAGAGLVALAVKQANVIDETAKLARNLGVSLKEFQAISLVAEEAGVSQEALGKAITKTQQAIYDASQGMETYAAAFRTLGLDTQELLKLTPDQQFNKIAEALSGVTNATERTALATDIFGRAGVAVIDMLENYGVRVDEARAFNDKFNISLNEVDSSKVEEANDAFARLWKVFDGIGNTVAVYFAPLITDLSNYLLQAGADGENFGTTLDRSMRLAGTAIDWVRQGIIGIKAFILEVTLAIQLMTLDVTKSLYDVANAASGLPIIGENMKAIAADLAAINTTTQQGASNVKKNYDDLTQSAGNFKTTIENVHESQKAAADRATEAVQRNAKSYDEVREALDKANEETKELNTETKDLNTSIKGIENSSNRAFEGYSRNLTQAQNETINWANSISGIFSGTVGQLLQGSKLSFLSGPLSQLAGDVANNLFSGGFSFPSFATGSKYIPRDMTARLHQGEMVIPRDQVGVGGGMEVNIINNASSSAQASAGLSSDGKSLEIIIDEIVAGNISRRGTRTSNALRSSGAPLSRG